MNFKYFFCNEIFKIFSIFSILVILFYLNVVELMFYWFLTKFLKNIFPLYYILYIEIFL